jgi:hypothetical protein
MTEDEWMACADPTRMLEAVISANPEWHTLTRRWLVWLGFVSKRPAVQVGERKLWLFNAACARRMWARLDELHRLAVEATERCVDGNESREAAIAATHAAWRSNSTVSTGFQLSTAMAGYMGRSPYAFCLYRLNDDLAMHAALLRDILGNPFRPAHAVDPSWLAWNDGIVAKLAAAIYEGRRFADLPILADALEDAGCADAAILAHCRGAGEHVRGCWVVDLLTGRG